MTAIQAAASWAKRKLIRIHPKRMQFQRFLDGLALDPATLPTPLPAPGPRDFVICGCARTGTSLLAAMLFQPPRVATVVEPWDGMRLPPRELFASIRDELGQTGRLARGTLDIPLLRREQRVKRVTEGQGSDAVALAADGFVGVKWPVYFRYVESLPDTKFLICLRHPMEVIASFKAIGGSVAEGQEYATAFNREMNRALAEMTGDHALRRIYLYDYVHTRLLPLLSKPNVLAVRYERWFTEPERLLGEIGAFLGVDVSQPPAKIRREAPKDVLTAGERELVRRECRTAESLGYSLTPSSGI